MEGELGEKEAVTAVVESTERRRWISPLSHALCSKQTERNLGETGKDNESWVGGQEVGHSDGNFFDQTARD